jgi:6-phosphogluconolactonase
MAEQLVISDRPLEAATRLLADAIARVDAELGWTRLAIPGGSALEVLRGVPALLQRGEWSRLRLTWVDERCADPQGPESNRGAAYASGILSAERPVARELPLWESDDTPERAVARVTRRFETDFSNGLDVSLLGLGEDGHIASIFPGHAARFSTKPVVHVPDSPKPPAQRITLGFKALRTARINVLYAVGASKQRALETILSGDALAPANILPGELHIVTDQPVGGRK